MSDLIQQKITALEIEHDKLAGEIDVLQAQKEDTADVIEKDDLLRRIKIRENRQEEIEEQIGELGKQSIKRVLDLEVEKFNYHKERTLFRPFLQHHRGKKIGAAMIHGDFDYGQNWIFKILLKKNSLNVKPILLNDDKVTQRNASWIDYFISKLGAALYKGEREKYEVFKRYKLDTATRLTLITERLKTRLSKGETLIIKSEDWLSGKIRKEDRTQFLEQFFQLCWKEWCKTLNPVIAKSNGVLLFVLLESTETPLLNEIQPHFELDLNQCVQTTKPLVFNIDPVEERDLDNWYIYHILNCENDQIIDKLSELNTLNKRQKLIQDAEGKHIELFYLLYEKCETEFDNYD